MKELRELYNKGTQGEWYLRHGDVLEVSVNRRYENGYCIEAICRPDSQDKGNLIAAMHNALPELLDAWEMVQALEWASLSEGWGKSCRDCVIKNVCLDDGSEIGICEKPFEEGRDRLLTAWREAQKIEGVE